MLGLPAFLLAGLEKPLPKALSGGVTLRTENLSHRNSAELKEFQNLGSRRIRRIPEPWFQKKPLGRQEKQVIKRYRKLPVLFSKEKMPFGNDGKKKQIHRK